MILKQLLNRINAEPGSGFILPRYRDLCFSNIPATVFSILGIPQKKDPLNELWKDKIKPKNRKKVILLLIDGFGFLQWLKYYRAFEFLSNFTKNGVVAPITTVFPSTTSATLTTIHSGLTPQQHALVEWWLYIRQIDRIIVSLPFTPMEEYGRDTLLKYGVSPKILFSGKTIYHSLKKSKIRPFCFSRGAYSGSIYSKLIHSGSTRMPFEVLSDLLVDLRNKVSSEHSRAYFYVYWDMVDHMSHSYGPYGEKIGAELNCLFYMLQKEFIEKIDARTAEETAIIVTADHGQINVSAKETLYLNRYPKLVESFQESHAGKKILPWGSPRDVFLQIKEEKLRLTFKYLKKILDGKAKVMLTDDAVKGGLFGRGRQHKEFRNRVGNITLLPYDNHTIWYEHVKGKKFHLTGMHGGLSPEEMLIPFAFANLSDLIK